VTDIGDRKLEDVLEPRYILVLICQWCGGKTGRIGGRPPDEWALELHSNRSYVPEPFKGADRMVTSVVSLADLLRPRPKASLHMSYWTDCPKCSNATCWLGDNAPAIREAIRKRQAVLALKPDSMWKSAKREDYRRQE